MVIAFTACTQQWVMTRPRAMVTLPPLLLLWEWPGYGTISDSVCVLFYNYDASATNELGL